MKAYSVAAEKALGGYWSQVGTIPYSEINNTFKMKNWRLSNESEDCMADFGRKRGLTLLILDRMYVAHYNHYMEHILHLYAAQQTYFPTRKVNRMMFLTASKDAAGFSTRDSINYQILKALWPNAKLMFKRNVERGIHEKSMILEHVLTSDRGGCHKNSRSTQWGKMNAGHIDECKQFLPSLRNKILKTFNLTKSSLHSEDIKGNENASPLLLNSMSEIESEAELRRKHIDSVYDKICGSASRGDGTKFFMSILARIPIPLLFIDRGEVNTLPPWNISDPNITEADITERKRIEEEGKTKVRRDLTPEIKEELYMQLRNAEVSIGHSRRNIDGYQTHVDLEMPSDCIGGSESIKLPLFNVSVVTMQGLSFREQISLLANTKIVMSMHGNGLTHLLWISPERTGEELLVEIFPHGAFTLDYQLQATISGINHFAFDARDGYINGSTDTTFGRPCYTKLKPYDITHNLNSVVDNLNVPLLIQQLRDATLSQLQSNMFPPENWSTRPCSKYFERGLNFDGEGK